MKKSLLTWATALAVVGAMALPVMAGGGGGGGGRGGRGGGGAGGGGFGGGAGGGGRGMAMTPEQQITSSLQRIQASLNMTAGDEWTVLSAKIQKVLEDQMKLAAGAQNPLQGGGRGGRGGMGGMGGGAAAADTTNPLAVARDDLSKSVATGATTDDASLKTKMTAVRDQRKKLEDQLATDQKALQALCSVRQEAILVSLGVLN